MRQTGHRLHLSRLMQATPRQVFSAWTTGERLAQWFCPKPWRTTDCVVDFRSGGGITAMMRGPGGESVAHASVFLEVEPDRRIVFTDAYESAWVPSANPFITAVVDIGEHVDGTTVGVAVHHWNEADLQRHRDMGFEAAWTIVLAQMEETALSL